MTIHATAFSTISVGAEEVETVAVADGDLDVTNYETDTYTEVNHVTNLGDLGDAATPVEQEFVGPGRTFRVKGAKDGGTLELAVGTDALDAGQTALRTVAADKRGSIGRRFKVTLNDAPAGAAPTPTTIYFRGVVMSARGSRQGASSLDTTTFSIAVNTELLVIDPETGDV